MDNKFNTMELDSILEETRNRKIAPSASVKDPKTETSARKPAVKMQVLEDDFIITDNFDDNPAPGNRPKKKKTGLIVTLCILGVILLVGIGGLTMYLASGSANIFADNVYVNGRSLEGLTMDKARELMKDVEEEMANGIKIDVKAGDKTYNYTKADFDYSFDTEAVLSEAKTYSEEKGFKTEKKNYEIKMTVADTTCEGIISKIAADIKTEPKNAEVTDFDPSADPMFTISDDEKGTSLDEQTSLAALTGFIKEGKISGVVDATVKEVEPEYTKSYLTENITLLSSFSTVSTNNANGNENMRVSLAACNGSVIEPGDTWSFNDCTGDSNLESNGYKPAGVIIEGRRETGVGGGICQTSTTIYNATLLCGMEVVERECHYYKSTYADAGRDATVDYGNIDLKMKNPFEYQLFMKCWMEGTKLFCEIYGLPSSEFDDIEITSTEPSYFDRGYKVSTTRTFFKDGEEVWAEELPSSTYYTSEPSSNTSSSSSSSSSSSASANRGNASSASSAVSSTPSASSAPASGGASSSTPSGGNTSSSTPSGGGTASSAPSDSGDTPGGDDIPDGGDSSEDGE